MREIRVLKKSDRDFKYRIALLKDALVCPELFVKEKKLHINKCYWIGNKIGTSYPDIYHYFTKLIWEREGIHASRDKNTSGDTTSGRYQLT